MRRFPLRPGLVLLPFALAAAWHLIAPREPPGPAATNTLNGVVRAATHPVEDARVRWQERCTFTDRRGRFAFAKPGATSGRVSAWKAGFAITSVPAARRPLLLTLTPLPLEDHADYAWIDPTPDAGKPNQCGNCHEQIFRDWQQSAHARSANGRRFRDHFGASLLKQRPEGAGVCAVCHAPTFSDPTLDYDVRKAPGVAGQGVHCDFCHKVVDAPTDKLGTRFGRDGLTLLRPADATQLFFGPLDDAHRDGEMFGFAPLYKESRYCASCHEGVVFGVHAYGTYSEWLRSPARAQGQQCQTCHTAADGHLKNVAPGKGGRDRDPWTLSSHRLPGGDDAMLGRCLKVGTVVRATAFSRTVTVELRAENVGHRVPTGFIDRHLLLVVEAFDAAGRPAALLQGPTLDAKAGPTLTGRPGWLYAKVLHDAAGAGPVAFWVEDARAASDTRLTPGVVDRRTFAFAAGAERVRVRLLYRRFWSADAAAHGWPDNEVVVHDRTLP